MKRLRKSDIRDLDERLPIDLDKKADVQLGDDVLLIDGTLAFFKHPDVQGWVPALPLLLDRPDLLPRITVDMGAVRFVTRGADIMRPGITDIEDFDAGALITVVEETHGKPLAVGRVTVSAADMRKATEGNVVESLHHVGDDLWNHHTN